MSTSTNLVDDFEESFSVLMQVLAKEDENFSSFDKDETRVDIDQATTKFLDVARQMEAFFLQKRFVLSALKPELIIKEEILDLKNEIQKKDELIKKHHEKINYWQAMLSDAQTWNKSSAQSNVPSSTGSTAGPSQGPPPPVNTAVPPGAAVPPGNASPNPAMIALQQQQQQQQLQMQQQQHLQQQQQMPVGMPSNGASTSGNVGSMLSPQQAMFMQQQGMGQRGTQFAGNQTGGNMLGPGPLAFLEKTTSNIGMPDGRR